MDPETYLQMQGKTREELLEESKPDAERELKREAVLAAIAEAEEIEVSDEEMVEALAHTAEHERTTPEKLLERLRENGRDAMVREDIRVRKAIDWSPTSAKPIPLEQAEAREKIWTPEKEREEKPASSGPRATTEPRSRPSGFYRVPRHEPSGPDGGRADLARRARLRHLLAPAERADRLPRHRRSPRTSPT